eukprot:m.356412 g.356412  ORF g.356412 m.356412 type:complete len:482 (-) comp16605_c0_seq8:2866-4311(-)
MLTHPLLWGLGAAVAGHDTVGTAAWLPLCVSASWSSSTATALVAFAFLRLRRCLRRCTSQAWAGSLALWCLWQSHRRPFAWLGDTEGTRGRVLAFLIAILGLSVSTLWVVHESVCLIPAVKVAFMRGSPTSPTVPCWIDRRGDFLNLSTLLSPTSDSNVYHLLEGPHGCGKTELLKRACHEAGAGVIYISVPEDVSKFHNDFATAVNFRFNEHVSLWNRIVSAVITPEVPDDVFDGTSRTLRVIKVAVAELKRDRGKPVVLVIDNTARLARRHLPTFELLQDFAKDRADEGTVTVVFSSSDGMVPTIRRSRSAASRLGDVVNLGDILVEDARRYLACRGVTGDAVINTTIDVTGRRIKLMQEASRILTTPGKSLEDVRRKFKLAVVDELVQLRIGTSPGESRSARAFGLWNASAVIVRNGFISFLDFGLFLDPNTDDYTAVVSSNIFLRRSDEERIYFQSKPVEDYMRAKFNELEQSVASK